MKGFALRYDLNDEREYDFGDLDTGYFNTSGKAQLEAGRLRALKNEGAGRQTKAQTASETRQQELASASGAPYCFFGSAYLISTYSRR